MPAQSTIEVCPPQLLSSADSAANHLGAGGQPASRCHADRRWGVVVV